MSHLFTIIDHRYLDASSVTYKGLSRLLRDLKQEKTEETIMQLGCTTVHENGRDWLFSEKTAMRRGRTTVHEKEYNSTRTSNCQRPRIHWRCEPEEKTGLGCF